jgi:hypothetical protein
MPKQAVSFQERLIDFVYTEETSKVEEMLDLAKALVKRKKVQAAEQEGMVQRAAAKAAKAAAKGGAGAVGTAAKAGAATSSSPATTTQAAPGVKKGPGRPKGAKNKKKGGVPVPVAPIAVQQQLAQVEEEPISGGPVAAEPQMVEEIPEPVVVG